MARGSAPLRRILAASSLLALTVSAGYAPAGAAPKTVDIGILAPITGPSSADGQYMVRGAQLAVKEINAAGGVRGYKFKVVTADVGGGAPDQVLSAVHTLQSEGVAAMMTGYASSTNFEEKYMAQIQMPYLISGNSAQTQAIIQPDPAKYPTVWSLTPSYGDYGTMLPKIFGQWLQNHTVKLHNKKVAIITSDNAYSLSISQGLVKTFKKDGWTIALNDEVPFQSIYSWGAVLAKIRAANPSVVIDTDYLPANDASFMEQFVQNPTNSLLFIQYGPSVPQFLSLTKAKSTGVLYDLLGGLILAPKAKRSEAFIKKYEAAYGPGIPGGYAALLWESVYVYAKALAKVGNPANHLAIGKALGKTVMQTPQGTLAFDPKTHLAKVGSHYTPFQLLQIWHGHRVLIYPGQFADGHFRTPPWMH